MGSLRKETLIKVALILVHFGIPVDSVIEYEVGTVARAFENGKKQVEDLSRRANVPMEGSCWKAALEDLQVECKMMTEESQARLALRFTSCFGELLGLSSFICERATPLKECMKQLDPGNMATFREYFLHTQDMCYYIKQEMWQEQTNYAVNRLTETADDVTMQMFEQKFMQEQILNSQQESVQVQANMKKDNEDLYNAVVKVKDVFDDFSETAKEHQHISTEIFDKLSRMQKLVSWIQGEMSLLDMIFFYFGAIVFGYFATATTRTRAARFWLVVLFMLAIWGEKMLYNYISNSDFGYDLNPEDVQWFIWMFRKGAAAAGTLIVLVSGALYRDIQTVNNNMLMNMNFALEKVVEFVNEQSNRVDVTSNGSPNYSPALLQGRNSGDGDSSDDDSFSNYSSDDSADNLEHELKVLNEEMENNENVEPDNPKGFSPLTTIGRFFGKEPSDQNTALISHGAGRMVQPSVSVRYNLRERSSATRENPILQQESVTDFARAIKKKKPAKKDAPIAPRTNYFSSDDDDQ